jgi:hypothetical protein
MRTPEPVAGGMDAGIEEIAGLDLRALPETVLASREPLLLRGLVADWPLVQAARQGPRAAIEYLRRFDTGLPVTALVAPAEAGGRMSYDATLDGFTFVPQRQRMTTVLDALEAHIDDPAPPGLYVGSTAIDACLPGVVDADAIGMGDRDPLVSLWLGNRSRIPAHQDVPDNLACVVAGRRRFTLFPPDQLPNLYIGPLDFTPAGQPVSLVDMTAPDLDRFPRYADALRHARVAELEPGDALLVPSMWWHHVEGLDAFNMLLNCWWRRSPGYMDTPMTALMTAILCMRDLPAHERAIWRDVFRHYIFEHGDDVAAHIPEGARRVLGPLDADTARMLRASLLKRLNR